MNLIAHADKDEMAKYKGQFDVIIDTVAEPHDVAMFVPLMRAMGTIVMIGGIPQPFSVSAFAYVLVRSSLYLKSLLYSVL